MLSFEEKEILKTENRHTEAEITVVVPAYKCEETINETLNSIINQTLNSFDIIIIVDGFLNNAILFDQINNFLKSKISNKWNSIVVRLYKNYGAPYVRNIASTYIKTKYTAFIDSDDIWEYSYLDKMVSSLKNSEDLTKIVYSQGIAFNNNKKLLRLLGSKNSMNYPDVIWLNGIGSPSGVAFKTEIYTKYKIFHDNDIRPLEDWEWYARVLQGGFEAKKTNNTFFFYRVHNSSFSAKTNNELISTLQIFNKHISHVEFDRYFDLLGLIASIVAYRKKDPSSIKYIFISLLICKNKKNMLIRLLALLIPEFFMNKYENLRLKYFIKKNNINLTNSFHL